MDSTAPLAFWGEDSLTSGDTYGIFDGSTVGEKDITGFLPGWHSITSTVVQYWFAKFLISWLIKTRPVTAADKASAVSVFSSERIFITVKSYPELVYCDIVTRWVGKGGESPKKAILSSRPEEPYSCSVVMTGNSGNTEVDFKICIYLFFVQVQFSNRIANGSISVNIPGGEKIMKEIKKLNIEFAFYMLSTWRTNICLLWPSATQRRYIQHVSRC